MSDARKADPIRDWLFVEKLLAEDEARRIEKLGIDEVRAELRAQGVDPARIPTGEQLRDRVLGRARRDNGRARTEPSPSGHVAHAVDVGHREGREPRVVPIRRARLVWVLAAAAVVLILIAAVKRPAIVAFFRGEHGDIGPLPPSTPHEVAEKLRYDAIGNCEQGAWTKCKELLDRATGMDPAGESEDLVQNLRADIAKATAPAPPAPDKPKP